MHVTKETVHEHFKNTNKTWGIGRGRFLKKIRDDMKRVLLIIEKKCFTILMVLIYLFFGLKIKYG